MAQTPSQIPSAIKSHKTPSEALKLSEQPQPGGPQGDECQVRGTLRRDPSTLEPSEVGEQGAAKEL